MLSDPMTLYKLMNLYMLKQVNFPLTNAQLTDFFLQHEYASYFTLQQALSELQESGLIRTESTHNTTRYEITREGEDTLSFFGGWSALRRYSGSLDSKSAVNLPMAEHRRRNAVSAVQRRAAQGTADAYKRHFYKNS